MQTANATSGALKLSWIPTIAGFLIGFLIVYGWQSGATQTRTPKQTLNGESHGADATKPQTNKKSDLTAATAAAASATQNPLKAADDLVFQAQYVEKQLKAPIEKLEKFLQQCELKTSKSQQVGQPDGDTVVRIEVAPFSHADVETFWNMAEQELLKLEPGLQSYFIARIQNIRALFLDHPQESGVLFVKQMEKKVPGEPSVQYWFFQTTTPSQYGLGEDGSIGLPSNQQLPQATAWFDQNTFKQPPRLKHLAAFKYN